MKAKLELADILHRHGPAYRHLHADSLDREQRRVMRAIEQCRTAALGGHVEQCDACGHQRIAYNSCGNRHCPKCQSLARAEWLDHRQADLLPVPYFHVVFTVPQEISAIAFQNKRTVYDILFQATAETLQTIAADPRHLGATIGFIALLHTWGAESGAPPASALCGPWRRPCCRRHALGGLSAWFLPACPRALAPVPATVS